MGFYVDPIKSSGFHILFGGFHSQSDGTQVNLNQSYGKNVLENTLLPLLNLQCITYLYACVQSPCIIIGYICT